MNKTIVTMFTTMDETVIVLMINVEMKAKFAKFTAMKNTEMTIFMMTDGLVGDNGNNELFLTQGRYSIRAVRS